MLESNKIVLTASDIATWIKKIYKDEESQMILRLAYFENFELEDIAEVVWAEFRHCDLELASLEEYKELINKIYDVRASFVSEIYYRMLEEE